MTTDNRSDLGKMLKQRRVMIPLTLQKAIENLMKEEKQNVQRSNVRGS